MKIYQVFDDDDMLIRNINPSSSKQEAIYSAINYEIDRINITLFERVIDNPKLLGCKYTYKEDNIRFIDLCLQEKYEEALAAGRFKLSIVEFELSNHTKPTISQYIIDLVNKIKKIIVFK